MVHRRSLVWSGFEHLPVATPALLPGSVVTAATGLSNYQIMVVVRRAEDGAAICSGLREGAWSDFAPLDAALGARLAAAGYELGRADRQRAEDLRRFRGEQDLGLLYAVDHRGGLLVNTDWWDGAGGDWRPVSLIPHGAGRFCFRVRPHDTAEDRAVFGVPVDGASPAAKVVDKVPEASGKPADPYAFASARAMDEGVFIFVVGEDCRLHSAFVGATPKGSDDGWASIDADFIAGGPLAAATTEQVDGRAMTYLFAVGADGRIYLNTAVHGREASRVTATPNRGLACRPSSVGNLSEHAHA